MRLPGACVLVVDDDSLVAFNHSDMLEDLGCQALRADSVATAFNALKARPFDALLLDHDLGDGKGWDLFKLLRANSIKCPPAIYLSATMASTLDQAAALPEVRATLSKPVSKEVLADALAGILRSAESQDERYP